MSQLLYFTVILVSRKWCEGLKQREMSLFGISVLLYLSLLVAVILWF